MLRANTKPYIPMKMPHTTVILQNVLYAARRKPAGVIPVGQHTPSVRERVRTADILVPTISRMERVPNAAIPVHTATQKRYILMKMSVQDITSTAMLQAVIPAEKQSQAGDIRDGAAALMQRPVP